MEEWCHEISRWSRSGESNEPSSNTNNGDCSSAVCSSKSAGVRQWWLRSGGSKTGTVRHSWEFATEGLWHCRSKADVNKQCWLRSAEVWFLQWSSGVTDAKHAALVLSSVESMIWVGTVIVLCTSVEELKRRLLSNGGVPLWWLRFDVLRHCRVKSGGVRLCCLKSGGVRQCSLNVSDSPSDKSCRLPLLLLLLLLLMELGGGSTGTRTSDIWMRASDCWSAWLKAAMYFMANLRVVIFVSFSLQLLSCWFWWADVAIWGTARRSVSKAALISRMRSLSRAFAVFRRYLLSGGGFCFGLVPPEIPSPLLHLGLAAARPRCSVSARFWRDRGLREYLSPRFGVCADSCSCLSSLETAPPALLLGSVCSFPLIGVNNTDVRTPVATDSEGRRVREFIFVSSDTAFTFP
jgi:hypothetical protein